MPSCVASEIVIIWPLAFDSTKRVWRVRSGAGQTRHLMLSARERCAGSDGCWIVCCSRGASVDTR